MSAPISDDREQSKMSVQRLNRQVLTCTLTLFDTLKRDVQEMLRRGTGTWSTWTDEEMRFKG